MVPLQTDYLNKKITRKVTHTTDKKITNYRARTCGGVSGILRDTVSRYSGRDTHRVDDDDDDDSARYDSRWEFGIDSHDIKFLIKCRDEDGNETVVHGPRKVTEGAVDTGILPVSGPATCE